MEKQLTGYPSVDRPWLKYYKPGADERANEIPNGKTVWDVIEEKLIEYKDIPAIEYFGRRISRPEFINMVYVWAKAFKAMGVKEDEVVAYYGPFFPDVGAITLALNMIGACPYFLKLAISPEALAEETKEIRFAIVFNDMWPNVSAEFSKDRFEKIIVITIPDGMKTPMREVIGLHMKRSRKKGDSWVPVGDKYIRLEAAKRLARGYQGNVRVPFVPNRSAFITSSSGTTIGGIVKGIVATNEMSLSLLSFGKESDIPISPGDKFLNNFPPTAATSLHGLFLTPLFRGGTILMDPRVSPQDFYKQLTEKKPNNVLITGTMWETFFNKLESEIANGKTFDLSFVSYWIVGGEGTNPQKYSKWNDILTKCGGKGIYSGYGQSELFSATNVESPNARYDVNSNSIMSVGIPYAGVTEGVFDEKGNELPYNHRGELYIKGNSVMKGYYNKPELTSQTKVNGWIHTGDFAEIDENGFVYIWGRITDKIDLEDGNSVYLFDIANKLKEFDCIDDAIVLPVPTQDQQKHVVAHIVWSGSFTEKEKVQYLTNLNEALEEYLPEEIVLYAYAEHDGMLPYSPTTLKKDRNKLSKQSSGYYQVHNGKLEDVVVKL